MRSAVDDLLRFALTHVYIVQVDVFSLSVEPSASRGILDFPLAIEMILQSEFSFKYRSRGRTGQNAVKGPTSVSAGVKEGQIPKVGGPHCEFQVRLRFINQTVCFYRGRIEPDVGVRHSGLSGTDFVLRGTVQRQGHQIRYAGWGIGLEVRCPGEVISFQLAFEPTVERARHVGKNAVFRVPGIGSCE